MTKRLTNRQREVLRRLARKDGQSPFALGASSHSGNVLENLLGLDLIRVADGKAFITAAGLEALGTGRRPEVSA